VANGFATEIHQLRRPPLSADNLSYLVIPVKTGIQTETEKEMFLFVFFSGSRNKPACR
jgi:hypothetical protein